MAMKRRSSFADPTAEQALNRVMRRMVRKAARRGLPVIGYEIWECNDPRCSIEHLV